MKTADGNGIQSIESMGKYENQSKQKFKKSACIDLGNRCSIHLSYGSDRRENSRFPGAYKFGRYACLFSRPGGRKSFPTAQKPFRAEHCCRRAAKNPSVRRKFVPCGPTIVPCAPVAGSCGRKSFRAAIIRSVRPKTPEMP